MELHIVLVEPEIPQNTGNIARTCASLGAVLHLIEPLGFSLADKYLKRAGLDYWQWVDVRVYKNFEEFLLKNVELDKFYVTTKAPKSYSEMKYTDKSAIIFGKETKGLKEELLKENLDRCVRIPMSEKIRSLNLATSAGIVAYEVARQNGFVNLEKAGKFHNEG